MAGVFITIYMAMSLFISPAFSQSGERQRTVVGAAGDAVTKPLEDLNLKSDKIPLVLHLAQSAPYRTDGLHECSSLQVAVQELDDVLGPDADELANQPGIARTALGVGGNILSGFIPFRGVVRTLSGANKKRADMLAAIYAGVARRSYLKGFLAAKACPKSWEAPSMPPHTLKSDLLEVETVPFLAIVPIEETREEIAGKAPQAAAQEPENQRAAQPY